MLHIVNKSPFERNALDSCLRLAAEGSAIFLFEDGVYGALRGTAVSSRVEAAMNTYDFFVLGPDLQARGLAAEKVIDGIKVVDYGGFVDLAVERGPVQSWL
jgi:tRNA 2-thiouridine synthesizing protein B